MNRFNKKKIAWLITGAVLLNSAFAEEDNSEVTQSVNEEGEIVFSAYKTASKLSTVGASIDVVNEEQLKRMQYTKVADVLRTIPGISMSQASKHSNNSVFIRGANAEHTLVLIDGVVVNDPANVGRTFDFSKLNTMNIERIEVLKGPQSTLYGSDAMGGVIQIFTKKGKERKTVLNVEGGGADNISTSILTSGRTDKLQYALGLGLEQERGISSADVKLGNEEKDRMKNRTASVNLNYAPIDQLNFDLILRYNRNRNDYDAFAGVGGDDLYLYQNTNQFVGRFAMNAYLFDERLETSLAYDLNDTRRKNYNESDHLNDLYERAWYKGRIETISWRNTLTLHKDFQSLFGVSHSKETASTYYYSESPYYDFESALPKKSNKLTSAYWDQHLNFGDRFFNTVGVRYDDHSEFGDAFTYRVTSRFNINKYVSVKGSIGTGYKAPTLYQLYEPTYGNKNLEAERSRGYDVGIVLYPHKSTELSLTYFHQKFKNMVGFEDNSYHNIGRAVTKGFELSSKTTINDQWAMGLNYTYLDARDKMLDMKLKRRPHHQLGANINFSPTNKSNIFLEGTYYSKRLDSDFSSYPSKDINLKPFWLMNLAVSYQVMPNVKLNARINNLLDKQYTTAFGYGQQRINGYLGVTVEF